MIRKAILTLGILATAAAGYAQSKFPCATDAYYKEQKAIFPGIAEQERKLKADIDQYLKGRMNTLNAKTTAGEENLPWPYDTIQLHIPVVAHVIYDYASVNSVAVVDNEVYGFIKRLNDYYNARNADLAYIIPPFIPYIGNAHITFHLATKDPQGKPTRGIVRSHSYLSNGGDDAAKIDLWPPDQYLNIFFENFIGRSTPNGTVLAYATFPTSYTNNPYSQGVISRGDQALAGIPGGQQSTIAHEVGHFLTLNHTWVSNGADAEASSICGDDEVDDTPPTVGHYTCTTLKKLYDTTCATGYYKNYDRPTAYHMFLDSSALGTHKDYPDTVNTQNIMDYSSCTSNMFTKGQTARMRASLRSSVGARSHLADSSNLRQTGIIDAAGNFIPAPDLPPVADFSVNKNFVCADGNTYVAITNRSYNDTVVNNTWAIDHDASNGNATSSNVSTTFGTPGWVNISLTVDGNNTGSNTLSRKDLIYAADPVGRNASGYFQEFNPGGDLDKYPIFNHYGTARKWEVVNNAGYYDKTSIRYANYDTRAYANIENATQSPGGDYADFYTPAFDLSGFGPICNVSFYTAGSFRTNKPSEMNDTLFVYASNDCGNTWRIMPDAKGGLVKGQIGNNGYRNDPLTPNYPSEWREQSIPVDPTTGRSDHTFFRFRFKSGTNYPNSTGFAYGTGNNFFIDRISISGAPLGVKNGIIVNLGMSVVPNPTSGAATVSLTGGDGSLAELTVTDVTGKLVYHSSVARVATTTKVEIPAAAIAVKGMYLVKVVTNGATETQKLVAY